MPDAYILGIDPGNENTAWALIDAETCRPVGCQKALNPFAYIGMVEAIDKVLTESNEKARIYVAIEMIASYGMPVGAEVFDTCVWIGKLIERFEKWGGAWDIRRIYRQEEKLTLCHSPRANDATIKQALVDRFAKGEPNYGKGNKAAPGWFYGFKADIWAAYAVAVTYKELHIIEGECDADGFEQFTD